MTLSNFLDIAVAFLLWILVVLIVDAGISLMEEWFAAKERWDEVRYRNKDEV